MVRRTKADAQATRSRLLDAAEHLFQARGVSRTSLNDIATAAGTTRGAMYWHFKDKADLFNAMMERVTLPMEAALHQTGQDAAGEPLEELRRAISAALRRIVSDVQTRRVFEVATHKVEYVDDLMPIKTRHVQARAVALGSLERSLEAAASRSALKLMVPLPVAAQALHALVVGLIHDWLLASSDFDLCVDGNRAVDALLAGLGLPPSGHAVPPATA
jgi:TetR/AcrR family acrAB operon transcriptional repressor